VWATSVSDQVDFCASEFVWMSSTRWNDQNLFLGETTGGGFEILRGDKTQGFISKTQAYN
jgi:hypothetical protein